MASFFHKYQRPLMLGLAFFALITFSVTGTMIAFFSRCTGGANQGLPSLVLQDGARHQVTIQEYEAAQMVFRLFVERFPLLDMGLDRDKEGASEAEKSHLFDRVLILYLASKAAGIGVSDAVIQDFIHSPLAQYYWRVKDQESYEQIVHRFFHTSVPQFEKAFMDLKRIQFYIQTLAAGENTSVLSVLDEAKKAGEVFQVEYVAWKEEDFEKDLKKKKISDKELLAFLEELPQGEKGPFLERRVVDLQVAWVEKKARAGAFKKALAALKPAKGSPGARFLEGLDKTLKSIGDAEIGRYYDEHKDSLYRLKEKPGSSASKPSSKPASRPASKPAEKKYRPLDRALKAEIRRILEVEKALDLVFAETTRAARKEGKKFDLKAFLSKNFPFLHVARTGLKAPKDLEKVSFLEGWKQAYTALAPAEGEFIPQVQTSGEAVFFARVVQVKENVPRPLSEIRKDLLDLYYKKKSKELAGKAARDFLAGLRVQGKKANPEGVKKILDEIEAAAKKRIQTLKSDLEKEIAQDEKILARKDIPQRAKEVYRKALKEKKAQLAALAEKEKEIRREERKKREEDLKKAELAKAGEIFASYAKSRKVPLVKVPPFPKNLAKFQSALLDAQEDDILRYLEGTEGVSKLEGLEKGQVSEVLEDPTSRSFLVVHMLDRHPKKVEDLTPGEVEDQIRKRKGDVVHEFTKKALSFESLRKRFRYTGFRNEANYKEGGKKKPAQ